MIRRNLDVIENVDRTVDLGPGGGEVVAQGTPE